MQKFIRIMAIVAASLVGLSLLLLLFSIPFQRMYAAEFYGYPDDMLAFLPQFPLVELLFCFLHLACIILLIICCGNGKGGIWLELLVFICLVLVLPALQNITSTSYSILLANTRGASFVAARSVAASLTSYCLIPSGWGRAIAYAVCGMSVVFKRMTKALAKKEEATGTSVES